MIPPSLGTPTMHRPPGDRVIPEMRDDQRCETQCIRAQLFLTDWTCQRLHPSHLPPSLPALSSVSTSAFLLRPRTVVVVVAVVVWLCTTRSCCYAVIVVVMRQYICLYTSCSCRYAVVLWLCIKGCYSVVVVVITL